MRMIYEYPWLRCKPGESFFVPALDPWVVALDGMRVGKLQLGKYTPISYKVGVHSAMLGVMFTVRPRHVPRAPPA